MHQNPASPLCPKQAVSVLMGGGGVRTRMSAAADQATGGTAETGMARPAEDDPFQVRRYCRLPWGPSESCLAHKCSIVG